MTDRNNKNHSENRYPFIKETIKEPPARKSPIVRKFLTASLCGVLFGVCATAVMALFFPGILQKIDDSKGESETVTLTPAEERKEADTSEETSGAENGDAEQEKEQQGDVLSIAENARKALVRVAALSSDADLLDDSFLDYGDEEGLVFLKSADAFYILTIYGDDNEEDSEIFRVNFSNGSSAEGRLCKKDSRTGFMVLSVSVDKLTQKDIEQIPAASLDISGEVELTQPMIAIGSPAGNYDSLVTGSVTSVSGRLEAADEEYTLFSTDMAGCEEGDGVLLNMEGKVAGIIYRSEEEPANVIRAVPVSQISSLLEVLANRQEICYIGIQGATISQFQSSNLGIPRGIYVNNVEENSPAMSSGVQSGDIIHSLNDTKIITMEEYSRTLQSIKAGTKTKIGLYRRNPSGKYVNVILNVSIKEK